VVFSVTGTTIPYLLGREKIIQRLLSDLTKTTPSHLTVIGPRSSGKTVLLNGLVTRLGQDGSFYDSVVLWDLGHFTPGSDRAFLKELCKQLGKGLSEAGNPYADHLLMAEDNEYGILKEVLEVINDEDRKILMLWDGFDKPLSNGKLTLNLWDQLRELASFDSLRLVTATRQPLIDLIRNEDSVTSDFWGIFDQAPVRVGCFDEQDIDAVLGELENYKFKSGAITELFNWTGGNPPLTLSLLNKILELNDSGEIGNLDVVLAANETQEDVDSILKSQWMDCSPTAQDLFISLCDHGSFQADKVGKGEKNELVSRGLASLVGKQLSASCQFMAGHSLTAVADTGSMARLFGAEDSYNHNIRSLLERRLAHIRVVDERLTRLVARSLEDIPNYTEDCLGNLNGIRERALILIWAKEFGGTRRVPQNVISYWTMPDRNPEKDKLIKGMMDRDEWRVPSDPFHQLRVLQLLTGGQNNFESKAKVTSKDTYVLLNAIQGFRNRSIHPEGQEINLGVAVAAMMTCIELLSCLAREQC